jgi:hypothetical protein
MSQAVIGMSGMTTPQRVLKARHIAVKLTGNANYTTPNPSIIQITDSATALETAYNNSRGQDSGMITIYKKKLKSFKQLMVLLLAFIQQASVGDDVIIESAGVDVKKAPTASQPVGKVVGVKGGKASLAGQSWLKWKRLQYKKSYIVDKSVDGIIWVDAKCPCTKSTVLITGLVSETYMWFRVAGVNGFGQGEWSDPIRIESM